MFGLNKILGFRDRIEVAGRERIVADRAPKLLYAIGDVHGCINELVRLERMIIEDARDVQGDKWLVMLGDYVDRGPASASVVAHLSATPPAGFKRICLAGNHEQMFLDAMRDPRSAAQWLALGGGETALSYGLSDAALLAGHRNPREFARTLQALVPADDLVWLESLPAALSIPGWTFVHAGVRAGSTLESQSDYDLLWTRLTDGAGLEALIPATRLVHGHTPVVEPIEEPWRICVDTGAYATSRLTALRIEDGDTTTFLSTGASAATSRQTTRAK
jgi:serine/threonine protein phosphatase 1